MFFFFCWQDILENEDVKLDNMFIASMVADIIRVSHNTYYVMRKTIKINSIFFFCSFILIFLLLFHLLNVFADGRLQQGVIYLHESPIRFHGSLCTSNCLIDSRWVVKLTDFGLFAFKKGIEDNSTDIQSMAAKCISKFHTKKLKIKQKN